jgi:hypothetical protein
MALVQRNELDKTEIVGEFKMVQCRHAIWVEDDVTGEVIGGKTFNRHVIAAYVEFQATQEATSV